MQCADEVLAQRWKEGDVSAFEALFCRYERRVLNVAARMIGSIDDAEDVVQETFIRANRCISGYRGGKFSTWIFRIAVNLCLDRAKRRCAKTCSIEDLVERVEWQGQQDRDSNPEDMLIREEFSRSVRTALASIPVHYRMLLVLKHIDGMSNEEIARVVGCSVNSLGVRLHRARQILRERLKPLMELNGGSEENEVQTGKIEDISAL